MSDAFEARLLLAVLGGRWNEAEALVARQSPDAARFAELARSCDVHPGVHAALQEADRWDLVPPEARESLTAFRKRCRTDNLLLLARVEQCLDLLLRNGIRPVALKGLDVLHRFGRPFDERTLDDVDLLVHPDEVPAALAVLDEHGWRGPPDERRTHWLRSSYEMPLWSPGPVAVLFEIHWGLAQEKRYRVEVEPVLSRAVPLEVAGRPVLRLDDHDAAAHLLLHHLQHYFDRRLKWMIDFLRIVRQPSFRWSVLSERLTEWGGRAAAGMALAHVEKLFPGSLPAGARRRLPAAVWRRALLLPLRSGHPLDLFRHTRSRKVQLYLAAALLERPTQLPGYLLERAVRDSRPGNVEIRTATAPRETDRGGRGPR